MNTSDRHNEGKWRLGKIKFYDPKKEFGFVQDLTVADYTEGEDDVYIGDNVSASHELVDDAYIAFQKVPSSRKPGTYKADDVHLLYDYPDDVEPLVEEVADESEREELRSYLKSERASWQIGKVKFFDSNKGFGFIQPLKPLDLLDGEDAYVNERNVNAESLSGNMHVAFSITPSGKPGEYQAVRVQPLAAFDRSSVSFAEDLVLWLLGGANMRPDVLAMTRLVPQSDVDEVLDLIEMVAWNDEQRPDRKRGTALRLLGKVLEKVEEEELLRPEWAERAREKYSQEVHRLVDHGIIPSSVVSTLWVEGLLPTLEPEAIDAFIDWVWQEDPPGEIIDLSYRSYRTSTLRDTKLRDIIRRFSQSDLTNWVDRHTEVVQESLQDASANTVPLLEKHLDILKVLRRERESDSAEDIGRYSEVVSRLAQHCYERDELTRTQAFSLWKDGTLAKITYLEFVEGYSDSRKREQRLDLLERLEPEQRRCFAVRRTKELLEIREDSSTQRSSSLTRWLKDLRSYLETEENDTSERTTQTLQEQCEAVLQEEARDKTQVILYGDGLLSTFPRDWLLQSATNMKRSDLEPVLQRIDSGDARKILSSRLEAIADIEDDTSTYNLDFLSSFRAYEKPNQYLEARWLLAASREILSDRQHVDFQVSMTEHVDVPTLVQLSQDGHLHVDLEPRIQEYLKDLTADAINTAQSWVEYGVLEADTFVDTLQTYLWNAHVENRETARCVQAAVRQLEEYAPGRLSLSDVSSSICRFVIRLTWWIDDENDRLKNVDFELPLLQKGLRWLSGEEQVTALRKASYLHAKERVTLTPEELAACSSFQIAGTDQSVNADRPAESSTPLSLSAELIIQTIRHVAETGEFPREGDLIEIVQHVTKDDPSCRVQLLDIFDRCEGRADELDMRTSPYDGKIEEVTQNGRRKFIISFEYFEELVESVKRLPRRRYDPDRKVWIVPAENEDQREATFEFARKHSFFIDLQDGKHWTNNEHLVEKPRKDRPQAVTYCEGRKAKRKDFETYDFWWCRNEKCYASCHGGHKESDWESYTVEDFLRLLDLQVTEDTRHGTIEMGQYHRFLGWINRFNQLIDRLYCRECGHILDASKSSNYSYYRVTDFHCSNISCPKYKEGIYLHHCLNPKCGSVIDSRDSEQCPNGWWICTNENCGACCSTETLRRRRENRKEIGLPTSDYIARFIEEKKGHIERSRHFCYECGKEMEEYKDEKFRCPEDHSEYDLVEANFDRTYRESQSG